MSTSGKLSQLQNLPNEVFRQVIKCLIDECTMNKNTGYPYPYYTSDRSQAERELKRSLLSMSLSSRRLNAVVTPFLYQQVILVKGIELHVPELLQEEYEIFPDRGIVTLALFLRTMLERPELRNYVNHLDLRFFLVHIKIDNSLNAPPYVSRAVKRWESGFSKKWEFGFSKKVFSCAKSEYDCAVLDHVGLSNGGTSHDLAQRIFMAILCLIPQLRTLAFPPPPGKRWCREDVDDFDEDLSTHRDRSYYHTLSSLLGLAYQDARLSSAILQNLDAVRFTVIPDFIPADSPVRYGSRSDYDPTLPADPPYTFQIDACLSILQAPNLRELETDMDTGIRGAGIHHQVPLANMKIQRAFLTSASFAQEMLEYACEHWPLTALAICGTNSTDHELDSDMRPQTPVADINAWNTSLTALATTLKTLDIATEVMDWKPLQQLSCLHSLVALEHLRIGLPLLNTNDGFITRPLAKVLPPRLKTLTINDWYAANVYELDLNQDSWQKGDPSVKENPRRYMRLLSLALHGFSQTCSSTHPFLRSVMFFGSTPMDEHFSEAERRAHREDGPQPGDVVFDGERLQKQFASSGVVFREFFYEQECDYRFKVVHVF
ncbi:hypothetical protein EDB80DRAFT_709320 [Ilyonectria destructans]|nr:hypothetical protein EDB80DRAFT_709320 [Ilyonectria destructans]